MDGKVEVTFGERLADTRNRRGLKQKDVAKELGLAISTISGYESGKNPDIPTLVKLAKCLDVSIDYLTGLSDFDMSLQEASEIITDLNELINKLVDKKLK